jgi:hypothetical protein
MFMRAAAVAVQRILVDHARHKRAARRGGRAGQFALAEGDRVIVSDPDTLLDIDSALTAQGDPAGAAADPNAERRARLRRQALDWLRTDRSVWDRLLGKEPDKVRQVIVQNLQHWLEDPDLARVRGPQLLCMQPESERRPWQTLWDDVADTLARAQRKATPEKSSDAR